MIAVASDPGSAARPSTVVDVFVERAAKTPQREAYFVFGRDGRWRPVDWRTCALQVRLLATALAALDIGHGDRIAICARTSLDWELAQMSGLYAGASVVGLDPNYSDALLASVLADSGAQALIVQNSATIARLGVAMLREFKLVATIDDEPRTAHSPVRSLHDFARSEGKISTPASRARPEDEALIVYSSGTTGTPRAIAYRHDQLLLAVHAILDAFSDIDENSRLVCWLPLSNLFQRIINLAAMVRGATSYIVEDPRAVMDHVRIANPRVFIGVPRFFQRLETGIMGRLEQGSRLNAFAVKQAIALGSRRAAALRSRDRVPVVTRALWPLADRLILARIRAAFGTELRYFVSGSAPMPHWLLEWFDAIGLPVLEAYGLSENIVPIATNRQGQRRLGTVGKPLSVHEVRLAEDGEILVRGAGVAANATNDGSGTAPAGVSGFLATRDLGEFDADGFLRITGRKSDVFKSPTGKWINPLEIEGRLARVRYIEHAIVSGAGREATIAVVSVPASWLQSRLDVGAAFSDAPGIGVEEKRRISQLRADVITALSELPPDQQLAGVLVVSSDAFSVASGELTTNLKIRRTHVETKFAAAIEQLHAAIARTTPSRGEIVVATAGHPAASTK